MDSPHQADTRAASQASPLLYSYFLASQHINYVDIFHLFSYACAADGSAGMAAKRTMTLILTDAETRALEGMCEKKALSMTALLRHALPLYQVVEARIEKGGKLFF